MKAWRFVGSLVIVAGCFLSSSCFSAGDDVDLQGAGATFPAPLYKRWFLEYYRQHPNVRVNYQAIGSGAGLRQFSEGLTDFGASDAYKKIDNAFLLPITAGSIVLCYNLPNGPSELKLSRGVYADIFLGKINQWSHAAIAKDNPGVKFPETDITVIRRADGSGTTYAFTKHLNAISPTWRKEKGGPGYEKSVVWPEGFLGGKGNSGVAALIQLTPGAIGYLEYGYAVLADFPMARLQNKAGQFVAPSTASGLAALGGPNEKKIPVDLHIEINDPEGDTAYPIVTYTWIICKRKYADQKLGATLKKVLEFCLTDGQKISEELHYLPLPRRVAEKSLEKINMIQTGP